LGVPEEEGGCEKGNENAGLRVPEQISLQVQVLGALPFLPQVPKHSPHNEGHDRRENQNKRLLVRPTVSCKNPLPKPHHTIRYCQVLRAPPFLAQVPKDAPKDERHSSRKKVADAVVRGRLPVRAAVLPEARHELDPEAARVLGVEADGGCAVGGFAQLGDQLLVAPGNERVWGFEKISGTWEMGTEV
jgi:hypothetical protein